ncbi:hypothetical protein Rsub_08665 [Raphidocelis subcapitata]|uniref:Uncharacterized protein n=1 Tax=Raphidocelis subcapitata TaxID=307507 RepID=A0A2V0PCQ2_9CHLO|nr:hypothetical protein Rsub_08665 [Raphidocelis subcapitata]|eukprot:GBF95683.1 hypothetical protein Rsub_08665 [Raphidocelis subcapitata]
MQCTINTGLFNMLLGGGSFALQGGVSRQINQIIQSEKARGGTHAPLTHCWLPRQHDAPHTRCGSQHPPPGSSPLSSLARPLRPPAPAARPAAPAGCRPPIPRLRPPSPPNKNPSDILNLANATAELYELVPRLGSICNNPTMPTAAIITAAAAAAGASISAVAAAASALAAPRRASC